MKCFEVLQIEPTKDKKEIKKAFAKLSKLIHPEEDKEAFLKLQQAYQNALAYASGQVIYEQNNIVIPFSNSQTQEIERSDDLFNEEDIVDESQAALTYVQQQCAQFPKKLTYRGFLQIFQNDMLKRQLEHFEACQYFDTFLSNMKWKISEQEAKILLKSFPSYPLPLTHKRLKRLGNTLLNTMLALFIFFICMGCIIIISEDDTSSTKPIESTNDNEVFINYIYDGIQIKDKTIYDKDGQVIVEEYDDCILGIHTIIYLKDQQYVIYETDTTKKIELEHVKEAHFVTTFDASQYHIAILKDDGWYLISETNLEPQPIENDYDSNMMVISKDDKLYFVKRSEE